MDTTETKRGRGRPESENPRSERLTISLTEDELEKIRAAAAVEGLQLGPWARWTLLKAIR